MNQVEIAKKILEQGNCSGIECSEDCPMLRKANKICMANYPVTNSDSLYRVKQWLKERECMIDLSVNQIVDPPVKCWVSDDNNMWFEKELVAIYNGKPIAKDFESLVNPLGWEYISLTDPTVQTKKIKKWERVEDVPVELWCNALFKADEEPTYCAEVMSPNKCTDCDGKLFTDLVYLPQGQPLTGKWLPFESEE